MQRFSVSMPLIPNKEKKHFLRIFLVPFFFDISIICPQCRLTWEWLLLSRSLLLSSNLNVSVEDVQTSLAAGTKMLIKQLTPCTVEESKLLHFVRFREKSLWKAPDLTPPPANQSEPLASPGNLNQPGKGEPIRTQHLTLHQKVTNQTRRLPFFEFFTR